MRASNDKLDVALVLGAHPAGKGRRRGFEQRAGYYNYGLDYPHFRVLVDYYISGLTAGVTKG